MAILCEFSKISEKELFFSKIFGTMQKWKNQSSYSFMNFPRPNNGFMLVLCQSVLIQTVNGSKFEAKMGDVIYLPMGCRYSATFTNTGSNKHYTNLLVNFNCIDSNANDYIFCKEPLILTSEHNYHKEFSDIIETFYSGNLLLLNGKFHMFLSTVSNEIVASVNEKHNDNTDEIIAFVQRNICNKISIQVLLDKFCMSESTLRRRFYSTTGMSPSAYIIYYKIKHSKKLLGMMEISIESIREMLGFYDISHFNRAFKQQIGMSPSEFRNSLIKM